MERKTVGFLLLSAVMGWIFSCSGRLPAQESCPDLDPGSRRLSAYRSRVLAYSWKMKRMESSIGEQEQEIRIARGDFYPQLSFDADFRYTGNPYEWEGEILSEPFRLRGNPFGYGANIGMEQSVYAGGTVRQKVAMEKNEYARLLLEKCRLKADIVHLADQYYWDVVACAEYLVVAQAYENSLRNLAEVVRKRVEVDYAGPDELLMVEVRLNDAEYRTSKAASRYEIAMMSLYSLAGIPYDSVWLVDEVLPENYGRVLLGKDLDSLAFSRPEVRLAEVGRDYAKSSRKWALSAFNPKISLGLEGSYGAPGYDFNSDMDWNYGAYASLHIPLVSGGKRRHTDLAGKLRERQAVHALYEEKDRAALEVRTSYFRYVESLEKVRLTGLSLRKAEESRALAEERYVQGRISVTDVLESEMSRLKAQYNFLESKREACSAWSDFERAAGLNSGECPNFANEPKIRPEK